MPEEVAVAAFDKKAPERLAPLDCVKGTGENTLDACRKREILYEFAVRG